MSELSHRKAVKLIQGNHLSSHERDALAAHLTGCEACRHYLAMHLHLSQNLQLAPVRTWPAPELKVALQRRVRNQQRRKQIMKPIQVLAGVAALIIIAAAGWMLLGNNAQEVEPAAIPAEVTVAPTEERIAVVETEIPTEVPTVLPTETAVPATEIPPTETSLPTESPTPDRMLITHPNDLIGTWHFAPRSIEHDEDFFRFYPDGTFAVADSVADLEAGNIKLVADYWFEDGLLWTRQPSVGQSHWNGGECFNNGKWRKTRFEVIVQDEQTLEIIAPGVSCKAQKQWLEGVYTRITAEPVDLHIDPDSGLLINPDSFPDDDSFIVEGTLMDVDLTSSDAPQLVMRLPSGETVTIVTQPSDQILDTAGNTVDLTTYEYEVSPLNPLRIRATVQKQDDGLLISDDLIVLFVE
jgi:hypothetical protein